MKEHLRTAKFFLSDKDKIGYSYELSFCVKSKSCMLMLDSKSDVHLMTDEKTPLNIIIEPHVG